MPERAFVLCAHLGRQYGPKLAMRTLDSLHVAGALELKAARLRGFEPLTNARPSWRRRKGWIFPNSGIRPEVPMQNPEILPIGAAES
jgi:hypothetical protein